MGLGIQTQNEIYTVLSIPLEWEDNTIIASHFRMLADEIEKEHMNIQLFRITCPINQPYGKSTLECVGYKHK